VSRYGESKRIIFDDERSAFMNWLLAGVTAGLVLSLSMTGRAHHSFAAEYDRGRTITVSGTVDRLEWTNPHARLYVKGKDETGKEQLWDFELGPPNGLMRNGWSRNSLKQGDKVTVEGYRSKLAPDGANARSVTTPDGKKVFAGSSAENPATQ
jgi:hypothetical protein